MAKLPTVIFDMTYSYFVAATFFVSLVYFANQLNILNHVDISPKSLLQALFNPLGAALATAKVIGLLALDLVATTALFVTATGVGLLANHLWTNWRFFHGY